MLTIATVLAGCSDIYFDRRETIAPSAGDAVQANQVAQMVDPWPPSSANRNIAFNGDVMRRAAERYRQGRVIPPVNATTSSVAYTNAQANAVSTANQVQQSSAPAPAQPAPSAWAGPTRP